MGLRSAGLRAFCASWWTSSPLLGLVPTFLPVTVGLLWCGGGHELPCPRPQWLWAGRGCGVPIALFYCRWVTMELLAVGDKTDCALRAGSGSDAPARAASS